MKLVRKFTKSHYATSKLKEQTNKSIIIPVVTRWSYLAMTYKRILEVFNELNDIASQKKWTKISHADHKLMELIVTFVEPFEEVTNKLQAGMTSTLSLVYPGIIALIEMLKVSSFLIMTYFIVFRLKKDWMRYAKH